MVTARNHLRDMTVQSIRRRAGTNAPASVADETKSAGQSLARPAVPAVVHTISIVSYLNERASEAATLAEISSDLGISKSHTHSILKTLSHFDWVLFDARRKTYQLQAGLLSYITSLLNYPILEHVRTTLSEFVKQADMPCVLTQPLPDRSFVVVDTFRSRQFMQIFYPIGYRFPGTASAQMRALYAWQDRKTIDEWLQDWRAVRHTEHTVIDKEGVLKEILDTRKRGYARSLSEFAPGMTGLARPIFDRDGKVSYILSVSYLGSDDEVDERKLAELMRAATAEIHRLTLARVPPDY
ncbi:helix-turn-helix domain-containing protein [Ancylobacter sp. A5.8]|uniref:IclR family transcriptional regulator n=1 Tax=Ancylobacter gelatini TaxID=2919920 RepID=UPI001F4E2FEF|nr:IclR family transcriptional regulator C-terminal domain-containing protein [Ancylobacter gelatini]MCJ8142344.1 helix-turn-helix domain-containing protein [Ancylobacter gelatini]